MDTLTIDTSVGEFVATQPSRSRVFQRLGIDFCCGGKISLAEACRRKGLDPTSTLDTLLHEKLGASDEPNPALMRLSELCDHIEARHHAPLREELPRVQAMARKVEAVHGEHYPWTRELAAVFERFAADLTLHMTKEEAILFPAIRRIESLGAQAGRELAAPIQAMEQEHAGAGDDLALMRLLSNGFTAPDGACATFRALLDGLREIDADMQLHVHKENNVLFPRTLALARR